jgi:16S rRNA (uracil1498-N3)-methyltransferase
LRPEAAPSLVRVDALPERGAEFDLSADESHYVARVCRARPGEEISATDGRGHLARLVVLDLERAVRVRLESVADAPRARRSIVCCGAPEGDRGDWLIEKLAELGVGTFLPIDTSRASWRTNASRLERWRRLAWAALRQSRGAWVMEIQPPSRWSDVLASLPEGGERWLADPAGAKPGRPGSAEISIGVIGPSSGLTGAERASLTGSGFEAMCLADTRLRAETAALCWAAWWASK